jgi:hypothetical protein
LDERNQHYGTPLTGYTDPSPRMPSEIQTMYATEVRQHLMLLGEERVLAHEAGLDHDRAYMADLEDEIATYRSAYMGAVVTEIAMLRARLDGPLQG